MPLILSENQVLLSLGYGNGSKLVELSKDGDQFTTKRLWHSRRMKAKFTNLIHHNDHIFGLDDGIFACIELNRGRPAWKDGRYGHGQILLRNNHILVMAEMGDIICWKPIRRNIPNSHVSPPSTARPGIHPPSPGNSCSSEIIRKPPVTSSRWRPP